MEDIKTGMNSHRIIIVIFCVFTGCIAVPEYNKECTVWNEVRKRLEADPKLITNCSRNAECTGMDCSGRYRYNGIYSLNNDLDLGYCFGITMHPCSQPVDLDFYMDIPAFEGSHQHTVNRSSIVMIPGSTQKLGEMGTATTYINVTISRRTISGDQYVNAAARLLVRIKGPISIASEWPEELQRQLMYPTSIPIPPCDKSVITPPHDPKSCQEYQPPATATTTTVKTNEDIRSSSTEGIPTTTSVKKVVANGTSIPVYSSSSSTTTTATTTTTTSYTSTSPVLSTMARIGDSCSSLNSLNECGHRQMCDKGTHRCICLPGHERNLSTMECVDATVYKRNNGTVVIPDPYKSESGSNHSNALVIGLSVAGVGLLLVGAISVFLFMMYKKHQSRYGQHELLVNNEDDDDDDPIDVST